MSYFGKRSNEVKATLHPILIDILDEAIINPPYDFGLHDGHRSIEKQNEYYKAKKSTIDGIKRRGYHNYKPSLAVDFHCSVIGHTWDYAYLEAIARHIKDVALVKFKIKLEWGGDWIKFVDAPHLQLPFHYRCHAENNKLY